MTRYAHENWLLAVFHSWWHVAAVAMSPDKTEFNANAKTEVYVK